MQIVNTTGQPCPAPLIATSKTLKETKDGDSFKVITDSRNAMNNISRFLTDNKTEFSVKETGSEWHIIITKKNSG